MTASVPVGADYLGKDSNEWPGAQPPGAASGDSTEGAIAEGAPHPLFVLHPLDARRSTRPCAWILQRVLSQKVHPPPCSCCILSMPEEAHVLVRVMEYDSAALRSSVTDLRFTITRDRLHSLIDLHIIIPLYRDMDSPTRRKEDPSRAHPSRDSCTMCQVPYLVLRPPA